MKKEFQAGTKAEQRTTADISTSASVEANPMLCDALLPFLKNEDSRWWVIQGIYFGYPLCCIIDFCKRGYKLTKEQKKIIKNREGFVPCQKCCKKILNNEVELKDLLKNRVSETSFR